MAKYYLDFVGLNTLVYDLNGYDPSQQIAGDADEVERLSYNNGSSRWGVKQNQIGRLHTSRDHSFAPYWLHRTYRNYRLFDAHGVYLRNSNADYFSALMIHRNGPYGFPSWKQTRISENPLSRRQRKENIYTIVEEPGKNISYRRNGKYYNLIRKYGEILVYRETPVTSRFKPVEVAGASKVVGDNGQAKYEKYVLKTSLGNSTVTFNNKNLAKRYNSIHHRTDDYSRLINFYLDGNLESNRSPMDAFEYFKYSETIYPPQEYAYRKDNRSRTTFTFPWKDSRVERRVRNNDNGFGLVSGSPPAVAEEFYNYGSLTSLWPLDAASGFEGENVQGWSQWDYLANHIVLRKPPFSDHGTGPDPNIDRSDAGILQNRYSFGSDISNVYTRPSINLYLRPAPRYAYPHNIAHFTSSCVAPSGMKIEGLNSGSSFTKISKLALPQGEAAWDAPKQSGKRPFYNSYEDYIQGAKQRAKDYTIIPEFKMSDHVELYQTKGLLEANEKLFSLTGSKLGVGDSSHDSFYEIYSNSDFMKHFSAIKEDHKNNVNPFSITLKCRAIKKLLPYEGFYPVQRSLDVSSRFYKSYSPHIAISASAVYGGYTVSGSNLPYFIQNMLDPLFAPGILYNSIKSGMAVGYPVITSSLSLQSQNVIYNPLFRENYFLHPGSIVSDALSVNRVFDDRLEFETLVDPITHLAGREIFCNKPHPYANNSASCTWNGAGDNLYVLMANNFFAETANFFLENNTMTSIISQNSSNPNVGNAEAGKKYRMRVKLYKSAATASAPLNVSGAYDTTGSTIYIPPQYSSGNCESFTMYSLPTAFGPASYHTSLDPQKGENFAFTPPYYDGQAFCDVEFTAHETKKYTLNEIINHIQNSGSYKQFRYYNVNYTSQENKTKRLNGSVWQNDFVNGCSGFETMPLNSSVNLFQQIIENKFGAADPRSETERQNWLSEEQQIIDASGDLHSRWAMQLKWETPMLNFNSYGAQDSVTMPLKGTQSVPRGMWHQYGLIEEDPAKGIYMQVTDMPHNWIQNILLERPEEIGSLADLCGFPKDPVRLGQTPASKKISEAVVAVPFILEEGDRKFFSLPREDINRAMGDQSERLTVDPSIVDMVDAMKKYNFPPPMDFVSLSGVEPFAMYIFEFHHELRRQDLTDIWQNLYPEITAKFEEAESTVTHPLLKKTLLGGGSYVNSLTEPIPDKDEQILGLPDEIRWMVFKVKKKAEINYFKKVLGDARPLAGMTGLPMDISYNWPYDFFSLVELAKIDAEVTFAKGQENDPRKIKEVYNVEYTRVPAPPMPEKAAVDPEKSPSTPSGPSGPGDYNVSDMPGGLYDMRVAEALVGGRLAAEVGRFNAQQAGRQSRQNLEELNRWMGSNGGVGVGNIYDPSVGGHTQGPRGDRTPNEGEDFGSFGFSMAAAMVGLSMNFGADSADVTTGQTPGYASPRGGSSGYSFGAGLIPRGVGMFGGATSLAGSLPMAGMFESFVQVNEVEVVEEMPQQNVVILPGY